MNSIVINTFDTESVRNVLSFLLCAVVNGNDFNFFGFKNAAEESRISTSFQIDLGLKFYI